MNFFLSIYLIFSSTALFSENSKLSTGAISPLSLYSNEWNDIKYNKCNTAVDAAYMSNGEKNVIYILNLIRSNPELFSNTVLKKYPALSGKDHLSANKYYYQSLITTLLELEPQEILYPDSTCYSSAKCHAYTSGISGYVGHERRSKDCKTKKHYYGECCDYGNSDPLEIVLSLLIDDGVPSLGHRNICLGGYRKIGVSIQPHSKYGTNTVLDFSW
jgi:uncharacterized protein YkwD